MATSTLGSKQPSNLAPKSSKPGNVALKLPKNPFFWGIIIWPISGKLRATFPAEIWLESSFSTSFAFLGFLWVTRGLYNRSRDSWLAAVSSHTNRGQERELEIHTGQLSCHRRAVDASLLTCGCVNSPALILSKGSGVSLAKNRLKSAKNRLWSAKIG